MRIHEINYKKNLLSWISLQCRIQGSGPGGRPLIFRPNWGPKKKWDRPPPPYLRVWMSAPSLIWLSGSVTALYGKIQDCGGNWWIRWIIQKVQKFATEEICHKFLRILIPRYDKSNVPLNSLSRNSNYAILICSLFHGMGVFLSTVFSTV